MNQLLRNSRPWQRFVASLTLGSLLTITATELAKASMEDSPRALVDEVWQIVHKEYVDRNFNQVDWLTLRQDLLSRDYESQTDAYQAIREALKELGDPYTRFLDPKEFEILTSQTSGELSGIGIILQIDQQTKEMLVLESVENSPALAAGIQAGDKIIKINGKPTSLMSLEQASEEIRGEPGTTVELELSRGEGEVFAITVTRAQIEIPSVSYSIKEEGNLKIGYIKLDEFSSHAAEQMKKAIETLQEQGVSAFVLDLRGNPGGLLFASVDIARMWMEEGVIVHTVDRLGGDRSYNANGTAITDLPLVVLVNENSASASEILAGALKENGRATLVGTHTFGKSTVQSVHHLSDGSGLAVTISRYYPPSRTNIYKKGIIPDISVNLTPEQELRLRNHPELFATTSDPQYSQAISYLQNPRQNLSQNPQPDN